MTVKSLPTTLLLSLVLAAIGCGGGNDFENGRTQTSDGNAADGTGKNGNGGKNGATDAGSDDAEGSDAGGDGIVDAGDDAGGGDAGGETGASVFASRVLPVFQAQCVSCHADPRIPVDTRGPLTVYSYDKMRAFLADGEGSTNNALFDKVRGIATHTGGNRCASGPTASPCKEIAAWWIAEFGEDGDEGGSGGSGSVGKISQVTSLGRVYGWAVDPADATAQVTVTFYVDGAKGQGTQVATTTANRSGADGNTPGDHAFYVDLPETARNGKARQLYAYVTIGGTDHLIGDAAYGYTAYSFTAAGRAYYEANVRGRLSGCAGCHTVSYEQQFYSLIAPSPVEGGTATNNQLINKPAQANGVSHGGDQRCNGVNASPCSEIQQWWRTEFGG